MSTRLVTDELELLQSLVDLPQHPRIIELGCGAAHLSRKLLQRLSACDRHRPGGGRTPDGQESAAAAGAPALRAGRCAGDSVCVIGAFDLALMLKSLHHVPLDLLDQALAEVHRVLRPQGLLYVSEPVFAGALNEVMRLFHDEEIVRAAALRRRAGGGGHRRLGAG